MERKRKQQPYRSCTLRIKVRACNSQQRSLCLRRPEDQGPPRAPVGCRGRVFLSQHMWPSSEAATYNQCAWVEGPGASDSGHRSHWPPGASLERLQNCPHLLPTWVFLHLSDFSALATQQRFISTISSGMPTFGERLKHFYNVDRHYREGKPA